MNQVAVQLTYARYCSRHIIRILASTDSRLTLSDGVC